MIEPQNEPKQPRKILEFLKGMGKTPGTLITVVAFCIAYICAMFYQDRVEGLEQQLHHRYKRQESAEGECALQVDDGAPATA